MKVTTSAEGTLFYRKFSEMALGEATDSHPHNWPHDWVLVKGKARVENEYPDGSIEVVKAIAPFHMQIKAIASHTVYSEEDDSQWWCVFPHRNKHGVLSDKCEGAKEAYC